MNPYIRFIPLSYGNQRIYETGEGPPLILLHGFCGCIEVFDSIIHQLTPHFRLIIPELPFHGENEVKGDFHHLEDSVNWLEEIVQFLGLSVFDIAGHSLGGYLAARYSLHFPEKIKKIILINSFSGKDTPEKRQNRFKTIQFIKKHGKETYIKAFVPQLFASPNNPYLSWTYSISLQTKEEGLIAFMMAMSARREATSDLRQSKIPLTYFAGELDEIINLEQIKLDADYSLGKIVPFKESGHFLMVEEPGKCSSEIISFLLEKESY